MADSESAQTYGPPERSEQRIINRIEGCCTGSKHKEAEECNRQ